MHRKLFLLFILFVFVWKGFSQNLNREVTEGQQAERLISDSLANPGNSAVCPPVFNINYLNLQLPTGFPFDTVGLWSNYMCFFTPCNGEEMIFQVFSPCSTTYGLSFMAANPCYFRVAYKETGTSCSQANWICATNYNCIVNNFYCEVTLDNNKTYDIIIDYNSISGVSYPDLVMFLMLSVPEVIGVTLDSICPNSVRVNWTNPSNNIEIEYGLAGFVKGTGTKISNALNPTLINNLNPFTQYDFYLKQVCGSYSSYTNNYHRVRTAKLCDTSQYLYCDNNNIVMGNSGTAASWTLSGCGSCYKNSAEKIFQFIPDTSGIYNIKHFYYGGSTQDELGVFYKQASSGCNEKNWTCIAHGSNQYNWNGNFGPLIAGDKYYIAFYGSGSCVFGGFCCNNFKLTCPSPLCSTPPSGISSNAINNSICVGESTSLFPVGSMLSASGLYHWYKDSCSGAAIATTKYVTVSPTTNKTYYLQITDSCGIIACDSITITVNNLPVPVLSLSSDTTICYNDSLLIQVNKNAGDSVQWFKNGVAVNAANDSVYNVTDSGSYSVIIFNQFGCSATSNTIKIRKSKPDNNLNLMGTVNLCQGDSVNISAVNVAGNTYQWSKDGANINGAVANNFTTIDSGSYMVFISDSIGCSIYSDSIIVVKSTLNNQLNLSGQINLCANDSINLSANKAVGNTYQWFKNGTNIIGAIANNFTATDSGSYMVFISDSIGCSANSDSVTVALLDTPNVILSSSTNIFCNGDSLMLSVNSLSVNSIQWLLNGAIINGATDTLYYAKQIGDYVVVAIDTNGCKGTSSSLNIIQSIPVTNIIPLGTVFICPGDTALLSTTAISGYTYQWLHDGAVINGATGNILSTPDSGFYFFSVVDTIGCTANSDSVEVNIAELPQVNIIPAGIISYYLPSNITIQAIADTSNSFQWFKNGNIIPGAFSSSYNATSIGVYKVRVTDTLGCVNFSPSLFLNSLSGSSFVDTTFQNKVGNQTASENNMITIMPNPSSTFTSIDFTVIKENHFDVSLKTITGQTIFIHHNFKENNLVIDVSKFNKGVYVLQITGDVNICKKLFVN